MRGVDLTEKQRLAIQHYATGLTQKQAGIQAGFTSEQAGNIVKALMQRPAAKSYLEKLHKEADTRAIADVRERKRWLSNVMRSDDARMCDRIKAVDTLNRMEGCYVQKIETDVNHGGSVMLVPMTASPGDWEKAAASQQQKLMQAAIEVT